KYPRKAGSAERQGIPPAYATELQTVMNTLNDLNQSKVEWDCGTSGLGVLVSDSLMFQRGDPTPSDQHLSHVYGLALPLLKRGMPVTPVQLENLTVSGYLESFRVLLLTYQGMKPLSPEVHAPLVKWVQQGGALVVVDDDSDPCNSVREWWNAGGMSYRTPRMHLFEQFGSAASSLAPEGKPTKVGKGFVTWLRANPSQLAYNKEGDSIISRTVKEAADAARVKWRETDYLLLRRGPYLIASGLDESVPCKPKVLNGRFVNLFDPELRVQTSTTLTPGSRLFLLDLNSVRSGKGRVLASACKTLPMKQEKNASTFMVEGVPDTPAIVLIRAGKNAPRAISLAGQTLTDYTFSAEDRLLWVRFTNTSAPRELKVEF
ncbi:MAG TPA: DUF4350 domain-containing protein, partial [Clostridia bacterium]|nr:DUF4350 domain-containing protein [Clostridia bacterium]